MTCYQKIICPNCGSDKIMKSGWNSLCFSKLEKMHDIVIRIVN